MVMAAIRMLSLLCIGAIAVMAAQPVAAQLRVTAVPEKVFVDRNNVDLYSGYLQRNHQIQIGDDDSGLLYQQDYRASTLGHVLCQSSGCTVFLDGDREEFTSSSATGPFTPKEQRGSTLTYNNNRYFYTTADGAKFEFVLVAIPLDFGNARGVMLTSATYPTGKTLNLHYTVDYYYGTVPWDPFSQPAQRFGRRLSHVTSNTGYRINFYYETDTINSFQDTPRWEYVNKVVAYNELDPACVASVSQCLAAGGWPSITANPMATLPRTYTDSNGRTTTYTRQTYSEQIRLPGSSSDDIVITYYNSGRVSSVAQADITTTYSYADSGNERTVTVQRESEPAEIYKFDIAKRKLTYHQDALGRITQHEYDAGGRLTKTTYPYGNAIQYGYDSRGNITTTTYIAKAGSGLANLVSTASYPPTCTQENAKICDKPSTVTDVRGQVTDYDYDEQSGVLISVTYPAPTTGGVRPQVRYSYTRLGNNGTPNATGIYRLTGISTCQTQASCAGTADEVKTTIGYGQNLLPTSVTTAAGNGTMSATVTRTYDKVGNLKTIDGPLAGTADTTHYRYNAGRELVGLIGPDPDGAGSLKHRAVRTSYDARGLVSKVEAGTVNSQSDSDWGAMAVLDRVEFSYDGYRRKTKEALITGGATRSVVQYSYDALGRLDCTAHRMNPAAFGTLPSSACTLSTQGAFGPDRITKLAYDRADRVTEQITGFGTSIAATEVTTTYTAGDQIATLKDAEGNLTTYAYDGHHRLTRTSYPNPSKGSGASSTTDYEELTYHATNGNLTSRRLRDNTSIVYGYDNLGRVTLKNLPGTELDVSYSYDNLNRLKTVSHTGHTLTNTYDVHGQLISQAGPLGTVSYEYDAAGRRTKLTYPGSGLYLNYDYLVTGEVSKIRENGATTGVGVLAAYAYDDRGRRTSVTRGNGTTTSYSYDNALRLGQLVQNLGGTSHDLQLDFSYNPAGQIITATRSNDVYAWQEAYNVSRGYTANGLNQYTASGPIVPSYDLRGNLTQAGTTTYGYSSENLLTSASGGITLGYDPLMRLYQTTSGSVTTRLAYDDQDLIAEYNGAGALLRRYVHGPGTDEPIVWYEGSGTADRRWLHADERGSIVAVTNSAGTVTAVNSYDEYGIPGATNQGRFQYTGQTWLVDLGLYYYKARLYSATLGRFLQTDPIGYQDGLNLYAYTGNDPVNRGDPAGTETTVVIGTKPDPFLYHWLDRFWWERERYYDRLWMSWLQTGGGGGGGATAPPKQSQPQRQQKLSACQVQYLAEELQRRALFTSHLKQVKFVSGLDADANLFTRRAYSNHTVWAVTQGNTVYVKPKHFDVVANLQTATGFEEIVHTAQFAEYGGAAFYWGYGITSLGGLISEGETYRGNILEAFAKGAARRMHERARTNMCK